MPAHRALGFVKQFMPTNHEVWTEAPPVPPLGVGTGGGPCTLGCSPIFFCPVLVLPNSQVSLNLRGWEAIVGERL